MQTTPMFIHYVTETDASTRFYADALGAPVIYQGPDFAMLGLAGGMRLGLWRAGEVTPAASVTPGAGELCVALPDAAALHALHDRLAGLGVPVLQAPAMMGFGLAFTVADPDGHRLRPYVPAAE